MGVSDPAAIQRRRQKILANSEARLARVYSTVTQSVPVQMKELSAEQEAIGAEDGIGRDKSAPIEEKLVNGEGEGSSKSLRPLELQSAGHGYIAPEHKTGGKDLHVSNSRIAKWAGFTNDSSPLAPKGPGVLPCRPTGSSTMALLSPSQALYASILQTTVLRTLLGILLGVVNAIYWMDFNVTECKAFTLILADISKYINRRMLVSHGQSKALGYILSVFHRMPGLIQRQPFLIVLGLNLLIIGLRFANILIYPSSMKRNSVVPTKSPGLVERLVLSLMPRLGMYMSALSVVHQASRTILDSFGGYLLIKICIILLCPSPL